MSFIISTSSYSQEQDTKDKDQCKEVLEWIYKDFTLNNLDLSYDRLMQKLLLSIHYANSSNKVDTNPELVQALDKMKSIDSDFDKYLKTPKRYRHNLIWRLITGDNSTSEPPRSNLSEAIRSWKQMQLKSPEVFKGMDQKYFLDDWDQTTLSLLEEVSDYNFKEHSFKNKLRGIARELRSAKKRILKQQAFKTKDLEDKIQQTNNEMLKAMIEGYEKNTENFESLCSPKELSVYIQRNQLLCPVPKKSSDINDLNIQLNSLSKILKDPNLLKQSPPERPKAKIYKLNYKVNPKATFCRRDPQMASMIVIHHTGESSEIDPIRINNNHIEASTRGEPWYQISYNYILNDNFQGATASSPKVFEGRAPNIKGAHAGGYTEPLTREERKRLERFPISCGNEEIGFKPVSLASQLNKRGGVSGNLVSFGVAVSGNFNEVKIPEIGGVAVPETINTDQLGVSLPSLESIKKVATLSCQLQKKYPRIKRIVPHSYFKVTDCPAAALALYFEEIKKETEKQGCKFEFILEKGGQR